MCLKGKEKKEKVEKGVNNRKLEIERYSVVDRAGRFCCICSEKNSCTALASCPTGHQVMH